MTQDYSEILSKCAQLATERQAQYGSAVPSVQLACDIADVTFGIKLTVDQFCKIMVALKLSREKFQPKDDNILDSINYMAIGLASKK